ncbi:hypothetical protein CEP54_011079 [Fusarium duplospermum]|uniref:RRM domain-containing protein n=1 Tax=Fusarium duplospermum TaxID=1325734 RepID=A0A428PGF0_9HYPO|nr:hypothetical protein CEP54_011079 [Fusarium duplospermum]
MSSSGWRRPQGAATQGDRGLRNAFSSLEFHYTEDSGSDNSDNNRLRPRALHVAKSFPPPTSVGDADDESQSFSGSGPSNSDGMTGRDNTGTDTSFTQEISNQEQIPQPLSNPEAIQDASGLAHGWDAQSCYPPEACVFVANLSQHYDDLTITSAVTKAFNEYGTVYVKIKRNKHQMPFGFAQYTKPADAENALAHLRGVEILGRPVRVERCNANLVFLVLRRDGSKVHHEEARSLLAPFGHIAKVEEIDTAIQGRLGFRNAVRVHFQMFDPQRNVIKGVGDNAEFLVVNYDFKVAQDASERDPTDITFMMAYDKDRRSAFIGNLPSHTTEFLVGELASKGGPIVDIKLKQSVENGTGFATFFAFVEFERPDGPDANGLRIGDNVLRVERKRTKPLPAATAPSTGPFGSVPPKRPHRRNASTFVTPCNEPAPTRRARGHLRSTSVRDVGGAKVSDFSMGAWPPKDESSPYEPSHSKTQQSASQQPNSFKRSSSYRQSSVYQPSYIELQGPQSPYQETSYRKPTYTGSEYQQMQYQRLQDEQAQASLQMSPHQRTHDLEILQPEPLRIPARGLLAFDETAAMGLPAMGPSAMGPPPMPADAPLASANNFRPSVHWAASPAVSSTASSDFDRNRNPYLSNAHRASTLGPSFGQRIAGHRSGPRRSVTNLFSSTEDAANRAKLALEESDDDNIQRTLAKYIQHANSQNITKAAEDAKKKAAEDATRKAFETAADLAKETAIANEEAA